MSENFTIRVNPVTQWSGAAGNNSYEIFIGPFKAGRYDPATFPGHVRRSKKVSAERRIIPPPGCG
jgi:hypothetical protein